MTDSLRRFGDFLIQLGLVTEGQVQEALALQPLTGTRVGEALLSLGYLTRGQLQRALALAVQKGDAVVLDRPPLGEILIGLRYALEPQVETGLASQQKTGRRLGEVLVEQGAITHKQLYEALGLQQRMSPALAPEPARSTPELNGQRVVVIDDSDLACALVHEGLSAQGYQVTCFSDPFLALEQIGMLKPDLVLTDLDMPGLDGSEVCRRLKHGPTHSLPVIILTANDADMLRARGLREGADDYVSKGASMQELATRVETVLRRARENSHLRWLFARYTSDAVVEELLRQGEVVLTGEKREVTVLFADLRNFTQLVQSGAPDEVLRLLNEVLGRLANVVLESGGTLDKLLGEGLMAVWGAPVRQPDDPTTAVSAALRMHSEIRSLNALGGPQFELGIGLDTGVVVAGSLGNARRTEYTCLGDTVNVASRLCALAGAGEILVGEGTKRALAAVGPLEALTPVRVKGQTQPVPLFRVTPAFDEALAAQRRF
jgi:adenylate cyclase